ncbi:MAG: FAD:protein FMN transferase [Thermoplasmatota archaeon]
MFSRPTLDFECCTTSWRIQAKGRGARRAIEAAHRVVRDLASELNAFDPSSAVAALNRTGTSDNPHILALVERARFYTGRTGGVFDIGRGRLEHELKAFIRGDSDARPSPSHQVAQATFQVADATLRTTGPLDLNGIAKGYIVDRAWEALASFGVEGFVDGGGDIAHPTGPVGIENPGGGPPFLAVLDTRWNIATSGRSKRRRDDLDHLYDARTGRIGSLHDQVTVIAKRDCTEADVLATTLSLLPVRTGIELLRSFDHVEALWLDNGTIQTTDDFHEHLFSNA